MLVHELRAGSSCTEYPPHTHPSRRPRILELEARRNQTVNRAFVLGRSHAREYARLCRRKTEFQIGAFYPTSALCPCSVTVAGISIIFIGIVWNSGCSSLASRHTRTKIVGKKISYFCERNAHLSNQRTGSNDLRKRRLGMARFALILGLEDQNFRERRALFEFCLRTNFLKSQNFFLVKN